MTLTGNNGDHWKHLSFLLHREAKEKEQEESSLKEKEQGETREGSSSLTAEEQEAKAAVILQSNYRGYKERKKFKERHKTMTSTSEEEEEEEKTVEAEDDDSDHTQVAEEDEDEASTVVGEEEMGEEQSAMDGEGQAEGGDGVSMEDETKAATVIQSNFRGHRERKRLEEEGKIPARKRTEVTPSEEKKAPGTGEQTTKDEASTAPKEEEDVSTDLDVSAVEIQLEDPEEARAAVVIQSNFRGHKERKRLEEEGKIAKKNKSSDSDVPTALAEAELVAGSLADLAAEFQGGADEVKAATIIQSNFRGHRDRMKMKAEREAKWQGKGQDPEEGEGETQAEAEVALDVSDVELERMDEVDAEREMLEEESAQQDAKDFEAFSKNVRCPHLNHVLNKETTQLWDFVSLGLF